MTPRTPSQVQRVLALLRSRPEGLNTTSLQELPTLDGGPPILRLAARIQQLKDAGYTISSRREANQTATYTLVSEPERVHASSTDTQADQPRSMIPPAEPEGLFDPVGFTERGGYEDAA